MTDRRALVVDTDTGTRLDRYLAEHLPDVSRSQLQRLIRDGAVLVNGQLARPAERLTAGDRVTVALPSPETDSAPVGTPQLDLVILHADDAIIVVNKPAGQVVHPAAGHRSDTLVNAVLARYPELGAAFEGARPGIVHRLDRDTSGVMVIARTPESAVHLKRQFGARTVEKTYLALVRGEVTPPEGLIDAPIGRDAARRKRMAALAGGRPARTVYRVLAGVAGYCWLEARPETGRTHQIRVHLAAIGHPVVADPVYGRRDRHIGRLALHAWRLGIDHPTSGQRLGFEAPLAEDLGAALAELGIRWARHGQGLGAVP